MLPTYQVGSITLNEMKYKNRQARLLARQKAYEQLKDKQGYTKPGSLNK